MFNAPHPAITILFVFGLLIVVLFPLLAWLLLHGQRDTQANLWFAGAGLYALTAFLFTLQFTLPAWLAFDVGSTLVVVFYLLMRESLRRELTQQATPWSWLLSITLVFGLVYGYIDLIGMRLQYGLLLSSVFFAVLALENTRLCWQLIRRTRSRACWIMGFAFALGFTLNSVRAYRIVSAGDGVSLLSFTPTSNLLLVAIFLGAICYSFGYWGFVLEKTQLEKVQQALKAQQAEQRREAAEAMADELKEVVHQRDQMVMMNSRFAAVNSLAMFNTAIIHELSQPLQAIQLCLEGLRLKAEEHNNTPSQQTSIDKALTLMGKLGQTLSALRSLVSSQQPRFEPVKLSTLLHDVLPIIEAECARHHVRFVLTIQDLNGTVRVDRVLLERVLLNMVANALDALRSDHNRSEQACLLLESALERSASQTHWILSVQDNGPGISPDMLSLIAQPFQTGKEDGVGLGLALANMVVRQWQGDLTVRNLTPQEGRGARVVVSIPMQEVRT